MSFLTSFCDLPQKEQFRLPFWWSSRLRSNAGLVSSRRRTPCVSLLRFRLRSPSGLVASRTTALIEGKLRPTPRASQACGAGPDAPSTSGPLGSALARRLLGLPLLSGGQHVVDEPVLLRLGRAHVEVAIDVLV